MQLNPEVWGPHYWFFMHTVAYAYPESPNNITKRKYYDLIVNMPLFIPDAEMGNKFAQMLDKYPPSPYLDSRESFMRWIHFIHNKVNEMLGKEDIPYLKSLEIYENQYKPKQVHLYEKLRLHRKYVQLVFILVFIACIYMYY
jgi:hypothetical protein